MQSVVLPIIRKMFLFGPTCLGSILTSPVSEILDDYSPRYGDFRQSRPCRVRRSANLESRTCDSRQNNFRSNHVRCMPVFRFRSGFAADSRGPAGLPWLQERGRASEIPACRLVRPSWQAFAHPLTESLISVPCAFSWRSRPSSVCRMRGDRSANPEGISFGRRVGTWVRPLSPHRCFSGCPVSQRFSVPRVLRSSRIPIGRGS
jgi:hypothetical protein